MPMKNAIMYYYELEPEKLVQTKQNYRFFIQHQLYFFVCYKETEEKLDAIQRLFDKNQSLQLPFHKIISNIHGKKLTMIDQNAYVLLKVVTKKREIHLYDLYAFSNIHLIGMEKSLNHQNWNLLWSKKIDYLEYQMSHFGLKYPLIKQSFAFFVGLAENAISYANYIDHSDVSVAHQRIYDHMTTFEFYNPLSVILDLKVRDAAEYFKVKIFHSFLSFHEIEYFLHYCISKQDYLAFYCRMLFPTPYFDLFEDIVIDQKEEREMQKFLEKKDTYLKYLKQIYFFIVKEVYIPKIDWIINIED